MPNGLTPIDRKKLDKIIKTLNTQEELLTARLSDMSDAIIGKLNNIDKNTGLSYVILRDQKGGKRKTHHRRRRKRFRKG